MRGRSARYVSGVAGCGVGMAVVVTGAVLLAAPSGKPAPNAGTVPKTGHAAAAPAASYGAPPARITVPGWFTAPVEPVAADVHGAVRVPHSPRELGWWALGGIPGSRRGTVLLAGHVDSRDAGLGVLVVLRDIPTGTPVDITATDGSHHRYTLTARRTYPKNALPADLFTGRGGERLALVTCTGPFDAAHGGYGNTLVVYGTPTGN